MSQNAAPRKGDTYLKFNGVDNYVEAQSISDYSVSTTGALTVAAWIKPDVLNFSYWEGSGYVHWLGKGEGAGTGGQQEWVFRMYNRDHTEERPPRPNRISFYLFNLEGGEGIGSYFQDALQEGTWILWSVWPMPRARISIGTANTGDAIPIEEPRMGNARFIFIPHRTRTSSWRSIRPQGYRICAWEREISEVSSQAALLG